MSETEKQYNSYIDEAGDPNLNIGVKGCSDFYVVCSITFDVQNLVEVLEIANETRKTYFGNAEMKSSSIGNSHKRRENVLGNLQKIKGRFIHALVVDKRKINSESGLRFKKSFIKYCAGRLLETIPKSMCDTNVFMDDHGSPEFRHEFLSYLRSRHIPDFFDRQGFEFVSSMSNTMIQVADIYAGTLLKICQGEIPKSFQDIIRPSLIILEKWPIQPDEVDFLEGLDEASEFDRLVARNSLLLAHNFIAEHESALDSDELFQVETLRFLLSQYEVSPGSYVNAYEILPYVNSTNLEEEITIRRFRSSIIANLRNAGVIIASSNQGYKIPNCRADMEAYVALVDGQIIPYLQRLKKAREHLLSSSLGKYDILRPELHPNLGKILDSLVF